MHELASAAANLTAARVQMALSLGWHIVVACLGVGFPPIILIAEYLGLRHGSEDALSLARRWSRAAGVLFAVGAVSGTILSFELGVLWPVLMGTFGAVFGFPFALEGIAFFIEAIFIGIYLYGWDRLTGWRHFLTGVPVAVSGIASAFFVVAANAWMNEPAGFDLVNGRLVHADPFAAMFNPATPVETVHMILAAIMVAGFLVASVHAWHVLRGSGGHRARLGFACAASIACLVTPAQIVVGDWAARYVADRQPAKLAAMEAQFATENGAPEHIGGIAVDGHLRYALEIPHGLSLLLTGNPNSRVVGLDAVPVDERPPVTIVHLSFDVMVAMGTGLLIVASWILVSGVWRRRLPQSRWFWRAAVASGPAAVVAMECGWIVTEVGRQPWIVWRVMRTADAVNPAPGLVSGVFVLAGVYVALTVLTVIALRRIGQSGPLPSEQQT